MPIVFDGSAGTVTGISTGGLPDGCVDTDTLANNAVTAAKTTAGITMVDQWRITSNLSGSGAAADITANWERNDTAGFEKTGTGMSQSSGIFSFPVTGKYLIMAKCNIYSERSGVNYYQRLQIYTTQNNSSYTSQSKDMEATQNNILEVKCRQVLSLMLLMSQLIK